MRRWFVVIVLALLASCGLKTADPSPWIYWSDADSGYIRGIEPAIHFRLHGVDAPETRSVRQVNGAKCEREIELGLLSKEAVLELTRGALIEVTADYGPDSFGRDVLDVSADGRDIATALIASGHAAPWDYDGGEAKPDWCLQK